MVLPWQRTRPRPAPPTCPRPTTRGAAEPELIEEWIDAGCYQRSKGVGDCTVIIPPPNVTGVLHMGHAMDDSIQDTIIRYNRMRGRSTRWILGTDHAGIATQTKVDKKLKGRAFSRLKIGREKFIDACWDWTHEYGGTIIKQIKRMGCSVDFSDEHFTMDPSTPRRAQGLLRLVPRRPHLPRQAHRQLVPHLHHGHLRRRGRVPGREGPPVVPALPAGGARGRRGVHRRRHDAPRDDARRHGRCREPLDPEKAKFVGTKVMLPIVNREIPIFSDYHVDANYFGSGFVKVTPAHDPNDYAMGQAHGLQQINIFDEHAVVVDGYGEFSGMSRDECRKAVVDWFDEHGLLDHVDELDHSVMHCYRCDSALEPWLSEQWFVACFDKLKGPALDAVTSADQVPPGPLDRPYTTWMENLKDWCISRQLWRDTHPGLLLRGLRPGRRVHGTTRTSARTATATTPTEDETGWTPGSAPSCGRSPRGLARPPRADGGPPPHEGARHPA